MQTHEPYRTLTPWLGFTPRERPRATPLPTCPADACRRAKACIRCGDGLYCRRTHMTPAEARHVGPKPAAGQGGTLPILPPKASFEQVEAYRMASDVLLARAEDATARMLAKWKSGALDQVYGKYDPKGVWKRPPARGFVEEEAAKRGR